MARPSLERELVQEFVTKWHLNVADRKAIPNGGLAGTVVIEEICAVVAEIGRYPIGWHPDADFAGGLVVRVDASHFRIYWKIEIGLSQFTLREVKEYESSHKAVREYAVQFFGASFDGIKIDWSR